MMYYPCPPQPAFIPTPYPGLLSSTDDVDIINYTAAAQAGPPGPPGPAGDTGPAGPPGLAGGFNGTINVANTGSSYQATNTDTYIGVNSDEPTLITLPLTPEPGQIIIVKLEMDAPIGNRKVTIMPPGTLTIDGENFLVLQQPWESATIIYNNNWYTV